MGQGALLGQAGSARPDGARPRLVAALTAVLATLFVVLLPSARAQVAAGLVAAYSFNEGTGTSVADSSGTGNGGSIGSATWTTQGKYGNALTFNGTSARVTVPDAPSLDLTNAMTLEAWVYPTSVTSAWRDVIYKGNDNYYLMATSTSASRPVAGGIFAGAHGETFGASALPVNTWTHLAATYDGATLTLYVNGVQVASKAQTGTLATSTQPLTIGGDPLFGQYFAGRIDEVRVYASALTQAQISTDMTTAIAGGTPTDTTPPSAPSNLNAAAASASQIDLSWTAATDNVAVTGYRIERCQGAGCSNFAQIATALTTTLADTGLSASTSYSYRVRAADAAGNLSSYSGTASATTQASSGGIPAGFVNEVVVPGITAATTMAFLPDGRMLVGELVSAGWGGGSGTSGATQKIWVVQPGASAPDSAPLLQLDASDLYDEQGLMDILVDPNFAQNGYYYVFYVHGSAGQQNHTRVSRFTALGNSTVPGSEVVLWEDPEVAEHEHFGGRLAWGNDGKLYITHGEHFIPSESPLLTSYRGKLLRINKDGTVPSDNPFYDGAGPNLDAIWARGLRNPFTLSIDSVTGRIYIGDVGGNDASTAKEEINLGVAGANYGWPQCEGPCNTAGITDPIYSYPHNGSDAAIVAGFVYRGTQFPSEYYGSLFFADYARNWIKRLTLDAAGNVTGVNNFIPTDGSPDGSLVGDPVKLIQGPDGSLYYVDIGFNANYAPNPAAIHRIRYTPSNQPPAAAASASPMSGQAPLAVQFSSAGSSDPEGAPLTYTWTFGDGGSATAANPTHTYQSAGQYGARLVVSDGASTTLSNDLTIVVGNPPTASITTAPPSETLFRAGDTITYAGTATDPEDGDLPASAFSWTILFRHATHIHPAGGPFTNTKSGTLTIPTTGHDFQGSTRYEIVLTVTDSTGLSTTTSVVVFPDKVNLTFSTVPAGLTVEIDGITRTTPFVLDDVKGFQHTINAPAQSSGGRSYTFASWSDGGTQSHGIVVPTVDQSYTATFQATGTPTPVAAYSFNEGTGTSVADSSGTGNGGSIGSATWTTQGKYGNALTFNGTSARVTVPDAPSLDLTNAMTLEAWVYPTSVTSAWRDVIYKGNDNYYLMATSTSASRPVAGGIFAGAHGETFGASALPVNTWTHLAATYDGATLTLYVNGVQVASKAQTGTLATSTQPLTIGGDPLFGQYFAGRIDEVRVYASALTQAQISTDMTTAIAGGTPTDTTPPSAPSNLNAAAASASQIDLSWTAATDNVAVTGYRIERCQGAGCSNFAQIATPSSPSFADTGLSPSTSYSYRVRATDAAGNLSGYSNTATAQTQAGSTGPALVAAYSFNEGTGTSVADSSGTGNGGSIGSATWTTQGKYGNALTFNGTSARVTVPDAPSLDLTNAMTLEAWVYPTSVTSAWRDVIYKGNDNYYLMATSTSASRPVAGGIFAGAHGETFGASALPVNTWTHLAATYDGATLTLYVNGVQVASKAQTGTLATSTQPLTIGGDPLFGQYFAGRIDEVRVYASALTQAQISTDMTTAL